MTTRRYQTINKCMYVGCVYGSLPGKMISETVVLGELALVLIQRLQIRY